MLTTLQIVLIIFAVILLAIAYLFWRRYLSRTMLMDRIAELEALRATGVALSTVDMDMAALSHRIAVESSHVIDNRTFQIGVFDGDLYRILFWSINGKQQTSRTFNLAEKGGIVGWMRDQRRSLLIRDFVKEQKSLPATPSYISDDPPRSALFIPLLYGDEVIGVMAAQSPKPNRFTEEDEQRLTVFANQAAAAIAHARLFQMERKQATHMRAVRQIAMQINALTTLDEVFTQTVMLIKETFQFEPVNIFEWDADKNLSCIIASSQSNWSARDAQIEGGRGLVWEAISSQQTIISNNTSKDGRFQPYTDEKTPIRSEINVPIIVGNAVWGVLNVQSSRVGMFAEPEKIALEALGEELAIGIEKSRQLSRQQEEAWIFSAQLQISRAIDISDGLDDALTAVTRLTVMLAGTADCAVLLWSENDARYHAADAYGYPPAIAAAFHASSFAVGDWGALDAVHVGQESLQTKRPLPWNRANPSPPHLLLPLQTTIRQGVMVVNSAGAMGNGENNRQQELLVNIASQTGRLIERAHLRIAQQAEAWVNTALLQVAEAVNSRIDLNDILDTITRLIPMLVGVESVIILIWDDETAQFTIGPSYGVGEMGRGLLSSTVIEADDLLLSTDPNLSETIRPLALPAWLEKVMGTAVAYNLPLIARGQVVGAMVIGVPTANLSVRRLQILNGIAHQAATAVVNNHLYEESAVRALMEKELNVARLIQSSLIPNGSPAIPGCDVASFWQAARQVSGDFYDFLPLPDDKWGIFVADVADKGVPAALFMALSRTIMRTVAFNRICPSDVLVRSNEIINRETASDLFVTTFYAVWDAGSSTLTYANGGHNPPLLLHANGKMSLLKGKGMALGVLPDIAIEERQIQLGAGDVLLFYTDGVTEAMNENLDEFGLKRLELAGKTAVLQDAPTILNAITAAIVAHTGATAQFDDITLVVMKVL
jgi:serine phosphatase RsbU (regulator of sigma subunit)/putative methionine-R-sulfoxide reductase with GAF domain